MSERVSRRHLLALGGSAVAVLGGAACRRASTTCGDAHGLSAEASAARQALGYLDTSADPAKTCAKCQHYIPAEDHCGECRVLKGPIHPEGTCRAFVAR